MLSLLVKLALDETAYCRMGNGSLGDSHGIRPIDESHHCAPMTITKLGEPAWNLHSDDLAEQFDDQLIEFDPIRHIRTFQQKG